MLLSSKRTGTVDKITGSFFFPSQKKKNEFDPAGKPYGELQIREKACICACVSPSMYLCSYAHIR